MGQFANLDGSIYRNCIRTPRGWYGVNGDEIRTLAILAFVAASRRCLRPASDCGHREGPIRCAVAGVVVEASSAALIEKTRTTVTDGAGRYRIEDLGPGTYQVRFTLQGWKPYQHEGVELTGSFTAIVNAELAVGSMTETITVIGETPVIDVHSAAREVTLSGDLVRSIPTVRSYNALIALIPASSPTSTTRSRARRRRRSRFTAAARTRGACRSTD